MGAGTGFAWQHDARPEGTATLSLFDDGAASAAEVARFVSSEQGFAVNSWLVPTERGIVVIDTQFTVTEADKLVKAVKDGSIDALVVQDPFNIGYLAVKAMTARLRGQPVERRIDTGARVATKDNVDSAEITQVIQPDLKKWLGE